MTSMVGDSVPVSILDSYWTWPTNLPVDDYWFWISIAMASIVFMLWLRGSWGLLSSPYTPAHICCEYAVTLRSALVYVAMALPIFFLPCHRHEIIGPVEHHTWSTCPQSPYWFLPTKLMHVYHWLPFWYAFVVTTHVGSFVSGARQSVFGVGAAILSICFLNWIIPGGAGSLSEGSEFSGKGLFEYNQALVMIYGIVFAYALFLSGRSAGWMQYTLNVFSSMFVSFMNPKADRELFRAIVWDADGNLNLNNRFMCEACLPLISIFVAFFSLGLVPCSRRSRERHLYRVQAQTALIKLADDTFGCLEHIVDAFGNDAKSFDAEFAFFYIRQLGARRSTIERQLQQGEWECYDQSTRDQLQKLSHFAELLRNLRQVLRVELDHLRSLGLEAKLLSNLKIQPLLSDFMAACEDVLRLYTRGILGSDESDPHNGDSSEDMFALVEKADYALVSALQELSSHGKAEESSPASSPKFFGPQATTASAFHAEIVFIEGLRSWPQEIKKFLERRREKKSVPSSTLGVHTVWNPKVWTSHEQNIYALRNTTSWMLAVWWGVYKRDFDSQCAATVGVLFSAAMGSSFDRNINSMLGMGMGLAIGNLPAMLVMRRGDDGHFTIMPYGILIYLLAMLVIWTLTMYGYLATGSKHSYACLLCVGYGSTQMLKHLQQLENWKKLSTTSAFLAVSDNFIGCGIIFTVDMLFAYFLNRGASSQVIAEVSRCVQCIHSILESIRLGTLEKDGTLTSTLQESIKRARSLDKETRHEGLVWTALWEVPYKPDSVHTILDICDAVQVAVFAIQESVTRCSRKDLSMQTLRSVLDDDLATCCCLYAKATRLVLGEVLDEALLEELLTSLDSKESVAYRRKNSDPEDYEDRVASAAVVSIHSGAWALRYSIRRLGVVLAERFCLNCDGSYRIQRMTSRSMESSKETIPDESPKSQKEKEKLRRRANFDCDRFTGQNWQSRRVTEWNE